MTSREEATRIAATVAFNISPGTEALDLFIREYDAQKAEPHTPHPGEQHQFRTECIKCGELGQLFVAILGPNEQARIEPRE